MTGPDYAQALNAHYAPSDLGGRTLAALRASGKETSSLTLDDLALLDQFHIGGKAATLELARLAGLQAGSRVLDIGSGLGGPARTLAAELGCEVTGLDLTEEFCRVAELLTARTGLADRVRFRHGSALDLPFAPATFDVVWTQHSTMNVADKETLYAESHRVLRTGGRLALHEIMAGPAGPPHFPVPWARDAALSFLRPAAELRALLAHSGWREREWVDASAAALTWYEAQRPAPGATPPVPPPLGLHLVLGDDFRTMGRNLVRNLAENRIAVIQAVFERA